MPDCAHADAGKSLVRERVAGSMTPDAFGGDADVKQVRAGVVNRVDSSGGCRAES
jgi:hypothetical protein